MTFVYHSELSCSMLVLSRNIICFAIAAGTGLESNHHFMFDSNINPGQFFFFFFNYEECRDLFNLKGHIESRFNKVWFRQLRVDLFNFRHYIESYTNDASVLIK